MCVAVNTHLKVEDRNICGHSHFSGIKGQCLQITEGLEVSNRQMVLFVQTEHAGPSSGGQQEN